METATLEPTATPGARTFRGRSLEELLPRVREELGPDAIVLRRREGLAGGVAGFFQRPYVEVDARLPEPGETAELTRNDRATNEGLSSPAIQALVEQASPFADTLARVIDPTHSTPADRAHDILAAAAAGAALPDPIAPAPAAAGAALPDPIAPASAAAGLYGPQPNAAAIAAAAEPVVPALPALAPAPVTVVAPEPVAAPDVPASEATQRAAAGLEAKLAASGLSATLAADLVGEAVAHGIPFAQPRQLKTLVRRALAHRIAPLADLGPEARTLAFVGAPGAGKSTAIAHLAAAYAAADAEVVVVALRSPDGGCDLAARLEPLGVSVIAATDAEQAARRVGRRNPLLTLIDAPAVRPGDRSAAAAMAALATELRTLGAGEIHLVLPATMSAAAGEELADAVRPLGARHLTLAHADLTARPGAAVELAASRHFSLSYICTGEGIELADPDTIARQLLP
jgi:flagellar biosynthesis GTPase FlhF